MLKNTTKAIALIALSATALTACAGNETTPQSAPQSEPASATQSEAKITVDGLDEITKAITKANTESGVFNANGARKSEPNAEHFGDYIQIDLSNAFKPENIVAKLKGKEVAVSELFADEAEMKKMLKDAQNGITELIDGQYARIMNLPVIKNGEMTPGYKEFATKAFPGVNPEDGMTVNSGFTPNDEDNLRDYNEFISGRMTKDEFINRMEQRDLATVSIPFGGPHLDLLKNDGIEGIAPSPESNRIIAKPRKLYVAKYEVKGEGWADVIGDADTPSDAWYFGLSYEYQIPKIDHRNNNKVYLTEPMVAVSAFNAVRNTEGKIIYGGYGTSIPLRFEERTKGTFTLADVETNWKAIEFK